MGGDAPDNTTRQAGLLVGAPTHILARMELSKLTGFHAAVEQAITDKFIDRRPTEAQLKTFVDMLIWLRAGKRRTDEEGMNVMVSQ